jgi:uncharacterized protein (TIGR02246 family)
MAKDEDLIRGVIENWLDATADGDLARILDLMTDDVEFLVPGQAPFGKKEFAGDPDSMEGMVFKGRSAIREVEVRDDLAYVRQDLAIEMTPKGGTPMRLSGPTLSIFKKAGDGKWRLFRDANFVGPEKSAP